VQYGCGLHAPEGWLNFDASPSLRIQRIPLLGRLTPVRFPAGARYGDICKGLPLADGSVEAVYCSHVLEHLTLEDMRAALKNTFRILRPGGAFRLVLPDFKLMAKAYLASQKPDAALIFVTSSGLGRKARPRGVAGMLRQWLGNSDHQWMWDFESLSLELAKAGFGSIRRAALGDGGDPMFAAVEQAPRWTPEEMLGIHCQRP
jgi:SAM-dependent methyltransferase